MLSFNEPPYDELMKAQKESWDSIEVDKVRTVYYYGGGAGWVNEKEFSANSDDRYYFMHDKFLGCLKEIINWDFDIIFRTNSSSYVNKNELVKFASTLPKERLYAGWKINGDGYNVVSGAGIFLSKDVAHLLIEKIDPNFEREEDVVIAKALFDNNIEIIDDKSRVDILNVKDEIPLSYHYRFKTDSRVQDTENMRLLHQLIINDTIRDNN